MSKVNFDIKKVSICLNAANQWLEDYSQEENPNKSILYIPEIQDSLLLALEGMVPESQIYEDFKIVIDSIASVNDARTLCYQLMSMFCYFLAISNDIYVPKPDNKF
jgi:hypothetical protein